MTEELTRTWSAGENRCDRCQAESWFHFERLTQLNEVETHVQDFYFCGHHGRRYADTLAAAGFEHTDYTGLINAEPSVSANV